MAKKQIPPILGWHELATRMGTLTSDGERGGDDYGRRALVELLGVNFLHDAVDYYLSHEEGGELVRSVLHILRADSAADRCLEIYQTETDPYRKAAAVELLRVVASERHLPLIVQFLNDPDPSIQNWGVGILDSLRNLGTISWEKLEPYVVLAQKHPNPEVRRLARDIRKASPSG